MTDKATERQAQNRDAAFECVAAVASAAATVLSLGRPSTAITMGYNAITGSVSCIAKITSLASGQTPEQYQQLSGGLSMLDPWGAAIGIATGGASLGNASLSTSLAIGQSQGELLFTLLEHPPRSLEPVQWLQVAADFTKYFGVVDDTDLRPEKLMGVTLRDAPPPKTVPESRDTITVDKRADND
jgi:hypothetical protein